MSTGIVGDVLQLVPPDAPGTVRQPDLLVVTKAGTAESIRSRRLLRAAGAVLAVEIVAPGSERTGTVALHEPLPVELDLAALG